MKRIASTLLCLCCFVIGRAQRSDSFSIRGVLPWHNFLSGPSAWNLDNYRQYLDSCAKAGINFIGFHNYTGGGERYAMYVEPMIRFQYRGLTPAACFDNSLTSRWAYLPMKVKDFAFGTSAAFKLPKGAEAFGADCSILSRNTEEQYKASQQLMQQVLKMAHERKMKFAMGFEFGVLPPEFFSLQDGQSGFYWPGEANMIPNPAHPLSIQLLYAAIDDILATYQGIDHIWLWLNEHSFMGADIHRALQDSAFRKLYDNNVHLFNEAGADEKTKFIGVWSLQYMRLAKDYLARKAPQVQLMLGGWGGGNQLPLLLGGLNRGLPKDIIFSCLNPDLGKTPQPAFLAVIAKDRPVIAMPWLEGDHQLWHYQPRVQLMRDHVQLAASQGAKGVIAIHWRTKETSFNFKTFTRFANDPGSQSDLATLYSGFLAACCGPLAAKELTAQFVEMDTLAYKRGSLSPEYYAYTPQWGRLDPADRSRVAKLIESIEMLLKKEKTPAFKKELEWFRDTFRFELLLDETGRCIEPAFNLRTSYLRSGAYEPAALQEARRQFEKAPVERLFKTFAARVQSRGELGQLSALNQKLWSEYVSL
ncbi:MAG: hypothetical protein J7578_23945, partial [Chitinophagaceae bacterium]|nr:hypothetical protein [Chitinophagaceae bacterium]